MGIFEAFLTYATCFALGAAGAFSISFSLWRTCRRMKLRIIDLENAHIQVRNRGYANQRWGNKEQLEAELAAMGAKATKPNVRKYDNDPLEY